jgi:hypothetical protein
MNRLYMEFPDDVLSIIKEYARPVTRPDWRTCGKMTRYHFKQEFKRVVMQRHYAILYCRNEDYSLIYHSYKPLFHIRRYDAMFHNL